MSPPYYDDGNATLVQTPTGTWIITYNGENRPIRFENAETQTVVECGYDSQGRRFEKKVTVAGTATLHHRYIYRGYLQIAALDLTRSAHPALWLVTWDPTQPTATRPLAIQKDGTWFTYGYDITKNICEVFGPAGYIRTAYSYAPFGAVTESGDVSQPFQWSSEVYDSELDLVYYNYRHYSPALGRFLSRDPIQEQGGLNLYAFVGNRLFLVFDRGGLAADRITIPANQVPVEPGYVRTGFLAKFEKGQHLVSLRLKTGLNLKGELIAEGKAEGMRIVYGKSFSKESFLISPEYIHEKMHFENYKKEYNSLVEDFNSYDEKCFTLKGRFWCDCPKKLSLYVEKRKALFIEKCRVADLTLEYDDYTPVQLQYYYNNVLKTGDKISDRGYSELDSAYAERVRDAFWGAISDVQEKVKKLEEEVKVLKNDLDTCF